MPRCIPLSRTVSPLLDENTSPQEQQQPQPPQSKSPPPNPSLKESRAFEHDRQRLKKAAALLARRARKAEAKMHPPAVKRQSKSGVGVCVPVSGRDNTDGEDDELGVEESEVEWGEARSLSLRVGVPEDAQWERERQRTGGMRRAEVALSDLLIARKPRRGREPDFEVVPPLRSVVVLDDITVPELDVDFDEPWEHVYASDADEDYNRLSYAKIAALN